MVPAWRKPQRTGALLLDAIRVPACITLVCLVKAFVESGAKNGQVAAQLA